MRTTEQTGKRKNNADLPESNDDIKHLQPDEATLDLPDVKDIPGQEHIRPIIAGEISDTTISSADEEGEGILDTDEDDLLQGSAFNVTKTEKQLLKQSSESMATEDDQDLQKAAPDSEDEEGTALNEKVDLSGDDLDVPGSEEDDANEEIGEEDEENNFYS